MDKIEALAEEVVDGVCSVDQFSVTLCLMIEELDDLALVDLAHRLMKQS